MWSNRIKEEENRRKIEEERRIRDKEFLKQKQQREEQKKEKNRHIIEEEKRMREELFRRPRPLIAEVEVTPTKSSITSQSVDDSKGRRL